MSSRHCSRGSPSRTASLIRVRADSSTSPLVTDGIVPDRGGGREPAFRFQRVTVRGRRPPALIASLVSPMDLDLLVIGSGPGGQRAAIQAAKLGKRVGVVERR